MPSQFFGLNIAYTGLLASNASMNTTANNIANVQTEGYSRQQVTQQAANALRIFQTYGCAGAGVETLAVERVRDDFYDQRYWSNNSRVGEYEQLQYYMKQVESYFDDNGKNAGFKTVFDQLMITGLEELLKNPDSVTGKEQFVGYAGSLAEYFNGVAGNLEKVQKDVNDEIKVKVDEINSLASEIASLNKQINTIELTGVKANELRDRRTLLVDALSQIVEVDVKETTVSDTNNPDRNTGGTRFTIRIAGGQVLVDGNDYNELECVSRTSQEKVNQTDIDGLYDIYWKDGSKFNIYGGAVGGALRGLMEMRDGNNGEYFHGIISDVDSKENTVTVEVGQHYLMDLNKCNLSDQGGVINLGNREYYYDSWTYSVSYDDDGNATYSYTFQLSKDKELNPNSVTNDRLGKQASVGTSVSYQGVPYYMAQMNEWIRTFSQKFNDILVKGYSGDVPGIELFMANMAAGGGQYVFSDKFRYDADKENYRAYLERVDKFKGAYKDGLRGAQPTPPVADADIQAMVDAYKKTLKDADDPMGEQEIEQLAKFYEQGLRDATASMSDAAIDAAADAKDADFEKEATLSISVGRDVTANDSYYLMTAKNFAISSTIENDPSRLANKTKPGDGVEQNDLLELLQKLATDKDKMSFRGSSASEFLQGILADVALNMSRAETFYESFADISYTIDTQRISISGVDEDEEAVNLVKFQNGYNLASKMIQTLTEVYDKLILETGV